MLNPWKLDMKRLRSTAGIHGATLNKNKNLSIFDQKINASINKHTIAYMAGHVNPLAKPCIERTSTSTPQCVDAAAGMHKLQMAVASCDHPNTFFVPKCCVATPPTTWDNTYIQ